MVLLNLPENYRDIETTVKEKEGKLGAYAMKRVAAGAHLPTPRFFEPAKRPDDRADYCLDKSYRYVQHMHAYHNRSSLIHYQRNQPGKIIVLYDGDERIAPKAASTMVERGYFNLFLLSGGLKVAFKVSRCFLERSVVTEFLETGRELSIIWLVKCQSTVPK